MGPEQCLAMVKAKSQVFFISFFIWREQSSFTFRMWVDSIYPKPWNPEDLKLCMGRNAEAAASRSTEPLLAMLGSSPRLCSEHPGPT